MNLNAPEVASPAELIDKAQALLYKQFGGAQQAKEGKGYAYGGLGLLAQHTSYYDGFAIALSMHHATAVCIRQSDLQENRIVFDESLALEVSSDEKNTNRKRSNVIAWRQLVEDILQSMLPENTAVDVALVSAVPTASLESFIASLSVALAKAVANFQQLPLPDGAVDKIRSLIVAAIGAEFSKAFIMVSLDVHPGKLCIIDTKTDELIPFDAPARDKLAWALIEVDKDSPRDFDFYHGLGEKGKLALELLQKDPQFNYDSFRDIHHIDLQRVLNVLPQRYRFIVRHLVNENKRVQVMIGAIRREDWQKLGGLLFISHSSVSTEWKGSSKAIDMVVKEAENMSLDGVYGACMTGRGGAIVVVGLPLALPAFIKKVDDQLKSAFKRPLKYWML